MDGQLRRISETAWEGTLTGYRVQVFRIRDQWHYAIFMPPPKSYTTICALADSMTDAAIKARRWIENQQFGSGSEKSSH